MLLGVDGHVQVVVSHDILGRAMIQCSRAPNMPQESQPPPPPTYHISASIYHTYRRASPHEALLWQLYDAIFGFEGSEFYIEEWKGLKGKTFKQVTCLNVLPSPLTLPAL